MLNRGYSARKADIELARKYSVSYTTMYRHLNPEFRKKEIEYRRQAHVIVRRKQILKPWYRKYRKLTLNLHKYLPELFEERTTLTSEQISDKILDGYQIRIRSPTIMNLIKKYQDLGKLQSVKEIGPGVYRRKMEF